MPAVRLFVSGNRSQVGKSSVCLGLLGSLLQSGFAPGEVSYIKPATQCTKTTLVAEFCKRNGVRSQHIGPIVFYSGFTRKFLKGETESSAELLAKVCTAVDRAAEGVKVCVIDGVGYPAVGSICGVDNAAVARAVRASVVLVAKPGVGDAVDSFNLDANWFISRGVRVLGAIYNRFSLTGYYSLDKCRPHLEQYFALRRKQGAEQKIYGYVPELLQPAEPAELVSSAGAPGPPTVRDTAAAAPALNDAKAAASSSGAFVARLIALVHEHVDVKQLVRDAGDVAAISVALRSVQGTAALCDFKVEPTPSKRKYVDSGGALAPLPADQAAAGLTVAAAAAETSQAPASEALAEKKPRVALDFDFSSFDSLDAAGTGA